MARQLRYYKVKFHQSNELINRIKREVAENKMLKKYHSQRHNATLFDGFVLEKLNNSWERSNNFVDTSVLLTLHTKQEKNLQPS